MIRDANVNWLWGFLMLLSKDVIFKIEARAIIEGLHLAWKKEIWQLEIECDNALLLETIVAGGAADSKMLELHFIHRMIPLNWKVCIRHIPKAHNAFTDHMAKVMATRFTKVQEFEEPPCSMQDLVHADYIGYIRN
ncbi:uncharacterized protein LOC108474958 [Gossypium arboreum]|uniref:uncharacterized protein LOC108474958 n=1 Tax=Gossypium arboreum TaxID=29729 RepID=UPI00081922C5|nr:uncharacterized protein LOC108474958 [Gossypium arboreum]